MCLKRFALLLVVFSLLSVPILWAEDCQELITEEELDDLIAIYERLSKRELAQEKRINELERLLEIAKKSSRISEEKVQRISQILSEAEESCNERLIEQRREAIKTGIVVAIVSAAIGFIGGLLI